MSEPPLLLLTKRTSAVLLAVQIVLLGKAQTFVKAVVLFEVGHKPTYVRCNIQANLVDEHAILSAGYRQSGAKVVKALFLCVAVCVAKAQLEALGATSSTLFAKLQPLCHVKKSLVVKLLHNKFQRKLWLHLKLAIVDNFHQLLHLGKTLLTLVLICDVVVGKVKRHVKLFN